MKIELPEYMLGCCIFALNTTEGGIHELRKIRQVLRHYGLTDIKVAEGCYDGELEQSYIVPIQDDTIDIVLEIARLYNQECVMMVNARGEVCLWYLQGDTLSIRCIGDLQEATAGHAQRCVGYTRVRHAFEDDRYFIVQES